MTLTLKVNANDPPVDALIIAEIINCEKKTNIIVSWCNEWKIDGNLQLIGGGDNELFAKSSNEVARYFGRTIATEMYGSMDLCARTEVDHWLSFAIGPLKQPQLKEDTFSYLDRILTTNTWLVDKKLTIADISIFGALVDVSYLEKFGRQYPCITRWYKQMLSLPAVGNALSSIKKNKLSTTVNRKSHIDDAVHRKMGARKQEGKFVDLPGAEMGKVVVRFPPEASGYLHIGHAKAALLNQYYAETFQGQLIMRFDDTNPAKESLEFEEAILEDIRLLNIKPDRFTHTSDYFDLILHYCTKLIKDDKAYVDDTPALLMKEQRDQKLISVNRNNPVAKNLQLWEEMQNGSSKGQECCVRAKIDYQSANGCLRDPTIYRCKPEPHPRTGTKYKVYPTYDFACPIVDSVENVTHTLRTTEYHDRDAQYYWIIDALGIRRPYIWEYSRLNMTNTVLSKRKLTWFVEQGLVDGWDDPRFPTVRGILRRGMTVEGLKQFIIAQGSSRSVVFMEWDKIWAFNKKVIDPIAVRYTALEYGQTVSVNVLDAKEEWLTVQNHPKDPSRGTKRVLVSPKVFIEKCDAEALVEGQNATFVNWGNLMVIKVHKTGNVVESVDAKLNLEDKNYKNTLKLTWLPAPSFDKDISCPEKELIPCYAVYFDHIISKPLLGKDDDFKDFITKDTRKEIQLLGEAEIKRVQKGEIIQLQRKGFFRCDVPYAATSPFSSKEQPLILFHVPDGHAMSTNPANSSNSTSTTAKSDATEQTKQEDTNAINEQILSQGDKVRRLKAEKADKATIDAEVKILVNLKAKYKASSGREWKANSESMKGSAKDKSGSTADVANSLSGKITQCNSKIKELQASIDAQMRNLAQLKAEYRNSTGKSWEDEFLVTATQTEEKNESLGKKETPSVDKLLDEIRQQGDKVRQLKTAKADKSTIDAEVKVLLSLKADYKAATGEEWKAGVVVAKAKAQVEDTNNLCEKIAEQGDKVRRLKNEKVSKTIIDEEVKVLLNLKADYKAVTGQNWEPGKITTKTAAPTEKRNVEVLSKEIETQGEKVRQLKGAKADQSIIEQQVQVLLRLKNDYKSMSGEEWKSQQLEMATSRKKKKEESIKCVKKFDNETTKSRDTETSKTGTRLGLEVRKEENFADWYSQVITKSGMIEYYDVSGCYILRPWSFAIWKTIKEHFDKQITKLGVQECYFPMFVTHAALEQEKTHIADFAPEVAWVTRCGDSDIAEPIAIRPTSETVMYPAYSKWLRSDTELPLRLNQWNNVVRWEFKDPKPFLRTREFLWQEGHSAFASKSEAEQEVLLILDLYANVYEDLLAVPVVKGRKTEKEKFAGGDYTTTVEAFIPTSGRGVQGATSHHLGQNFSKMFNIQIEGATEGEEKCYVYQNSWGMTTRTIGVMIMVHGDDKGLVLPPAVASIQAIIVPCGITATTTPQQRESLMLECTKLENDLSKNESLRVKADYRSNRTPGWKFNHWELKGVPVRIELGPKDLEKNQVTFVRRDNHEKVTASREKAVEFLRKLLTEIQADMLTRARKDMHDHIKQVENWSEFSMQLNKKNLILSPFCGETSCEENIKADSANHNDNAEETGTLAMGAKSLCIPFDQPKSAMPLDCMKCIHPSCQNKPKFYTLFGRSY